MYKPLISIIIPTFNRAHLIAETLDSVIAQTYPNWECLVVDDGSSDSTSSLMSEYCKKDSRFKYHLRPVNRIKGANACRNYGFEISKGEYINWFDDDDLMHENKLSIQLEDLINSPSGFSVCQTLVFKDSINNIIGLRSKHIHSNNVFEDYLTQQLAIMTPSALWNKQFLLSFEYLFDEELKAAQEWEFYCRVLYSNPEYNVTEKALVYIRQHAQSITYNKKTLERDWHYFLARQKIYYNKALQLNNNCKNVLQDFLLNKFKEFIYARDIKKSTMAFNNYLLKENNINLKGKLYAFLGIISFFVINKGYFFVDKIKYNK